MFKYDDLVNYTEPKICPKDLKMDKEWFVFFRISHPDTGIKKMFKYRGELNNIENLKERKKTAENMAYMLREKLRKGWNPITDNVREKPEDKSLIESLTEILDGKLAIMRKSSNKTYKKITATFFEYMNQAKLSHLKPSEFNFQMAYAYMDYLLIKKKYSGKTYNNHFEVMKIFFNALCDRRIITENPFKGIRKMNEEDGKNFPFTDNEKEKLKAYFEKKDRHFYVACMLTYYCFLRRTELIGLRVEDINLEKKTIIIHSGVSKNHKQQSVTIPTQLEPLLREINLDQYPGHWYVFGKDQKVNELPTKKPDYISYKFRKIADDLGIDKRKGYYSHKHSGVCALFDKTKDPYLVQHQCRHSDINITMGYMRSLGLTVSEKIRDVDFGF